MQKKEGDNCKSATANGEDQKPAKKDSPNKAGAKDLKKDKHKKKVEEVSDDEDLDSEDFGDDNDDSFDDDFDDEESLPEGEEEEFDLEKYKKFKEELEKEELANGAN